MILALYGAGGVGRELIECAQANSRWEKIIFVDDITNQKIYAGVKIYRFEEIEQFSGNIEFIIANGEPANREYLYKKIKSAGYPMGSLIDKRSSIAPSAKIEEGCIIYKCRIGPDSHIKANTLIGEQVIIGHDVIIGCNCIFSARSFSGGYTIIEDGTYIAPGAMLKDRIHIGKDSIIGLGAVVLRNVREKSIMIGNPAKKIGDNNERKVFGI